MLESESVVSSESGLGYLNDKGFTFCRYSDASQMRSMQCVLCTWWACRDSYCFTLNTADHTPGRWDRGPWRCRRTLRELFEPISNIHTAPPCTAAPVMATNGTELPVP